MANFTALKTAINNAIKTNGNEEITGAILQAILDAMVETLGDSAINDLENAITTEVTNRENAVGGVADDLAAEALARANKDNQLDGRINQEEYNRQNADAALSQTMSQGFQTLGSQMTALNAAISALNAAYQNGYLYGGIATPSSSPSNNKCFYIALQGGTYTNFGGVGVVEGINIIKNDSGWKVEHIYDQTTLLNEFYLLRQQVIQAITSFTPIAIEGDVTNAPDEEDLTSNANHLLQFKNNAYSPLEFSGLGRKYLRKNIAPLSESAPFNGFVEGVTAEETLSGTPTQIFWDRMNTRFVGIKDGVYYLDWTDSDNYVPVSTSLVYMYNGTPYQWTGSDFIVDETEVPNLVNCLTQDMINEANTIYIIRYDYTLKEDITIPANCVLEFDGGSVSAGSGQNMNTITGTNTGINAGLVKIFNIDVTLAGTWNVVEAYPEWFGANGDGINDDTVAIQKVINSFTSVCCRSTSIYLVSDIIIISHKSTFDLNGSIIRCSTNMREGTSQCKPIINIASDNVTVINGTFDTSLETLKRAGIIADFESLHVTGHNICIRNINFINIGGDCIGALDVENVIVSNIYMNGCSYYSKHACIYAYGCSNINYDTVYAEDCYGKATHTGYSEYITYSHINVKNQSNAEDSGIGACGVYCGYENKKCTISDCNIESGMIGLKISLYAEDVTVVNTNIMATELGMIIQGCKNVNISQSNIIYGSKGIEVSEHPDIVEHSLKIRANNINISNCSFEPKEGNTTKWAVYMWNMDNGLFANNHIIGSLLCNNIKNYNIKSNKFNIDNYSVNTGLNVNKLADVVLSNSQYCTIQENVIYNSYVNATDIIKVIYVLNGESIYVDRNTIMLIDTKTSNIGISIINYAKDGTSINNTFYGQLTHYEKNNGTRKWIIDEPKGGTTTNRPNGTTINVGFMYLDVTLGKPIFAKSVSSDTVVWVDATGATV